MYMKFVVKTGKIYLGYMATVWSYYFLYRNHSEIQKKTIQYWKNNVFNN